MSIPGNRQGFLSSNNDRWVPACFISNGRNDISVAHRFYGKPAWIVHIIDGFATLSTDTSHVIRGVAPAWRLVDEAVVIRSTRACVGARVAEIYCVVTTAEFQTLLDVANVVRQLSCDGYPPWSLLLFLNNHKNSTNNH